MRVGRLRVVDVGDAADLADGLDAVVAELQCFQPLGHRLRAEAGGRCLNGGRVDVGQRDGRALGDIGAGELQPDAARLILSGYADLNGLIGAINDAGITRFISKPWNDYELIATLGQVLTLRELTLENQRLADQVRLEAGALSAEEIERKRLEAIEPGITRVIWGPDGSVLLDESLLDDAAH